LGQCTDVYIQNSRQERNSGQQARMGSSCWSLFAQLHTHSFEQERSNLANEINIRNSKFYRVRQRKYETLLQYHRKFESLVCAMESVKMSFIKPCMIQKVAESHGRTFRGATALCFVEQWGLDSNLRSRSLSVWLYRRLEGKL
jgi:hypothetical protein